MEGNEGTEGVAQTAAMISAVHENRNVKVVVPLGTKGLQTQDETQKIVKLR